jgi:hypothetical protein
VIEAEPKGSNFGRTSIKMSKPEQRFSPKGRTTPHWYTLGIGINIVLVLKLILPQVPTRKYEVDVS